MNYLPFFSKFQSSFLQNFAREAARYRVVDCFEAQTNLVSKHLLFFQQGNSLLATQESFKHRIYLTKTLEGTNTQQKNTLFENFQNITCANYSCKYFFCRINAIDSPVLSTSRRVNFVNLRNFSSKLSHWSIWELIKGVFYW